MTGSDLFLPLLGIALVGAASVFALLPLALNRAPGLAEAAPETPAAQRFQLYRQVLELEFDHQTGKLSDEDLQASSADLLARAAALLESAQPETSAIDEEIEREIAATRQVLAAARAAKDRGA